MYSAKERGDQAYREGRFEDAVRCFNEAIEAGGPDVYLAYSNRCAALSKLRRWDAALADAQTVTTLRPSFAKGWSRLGACLAAKGRHADSRAAYDEAARLGSHPLAGVRAALARAVSRLDATTVALVVAALLALVWFAQQPRYYYGPPSQSLGMGGMAAIMLAAWKLPPYFGHAPFFGMSPWTLLWLIRMFANQGMSRRSMPFPQRSFRRRSFY